MPTVPPNTDQNEFAGLEDIPQAEITEGDITFDDNDGLFIPPSDGGIFTDYLIRNRFEKDRHRYMLPVSSPGGFNGQSVAFVQLAAPTLLWICDWTAEKALSQPEVPDPNCVPDDWILLDDHWEPAEVVPLADGITPIYRISGTYVYGHRNPDLNTWKDIFFGAPPWFDSSSTDRSMPDEKIICNVSVPDDGSSAGPGGEIF